MLRIRLHIACLSVSLILLCGMRAGRAQTLSDTLQFDVFTLRTSPLTVSAPFTQSTVDTALLQDPANLTLDQVLSATSPVFIRSYGQGALASASFRGTGAAHTQVFWNGLPVNSTVLGQSDLALVPLDWADDIRILHGPASLITGNGGLGGSIQLRTAPQWETPFTASVTQLAGSFNRWSTRGSARWTQGKWHSRTQVLFDRTDNDFDFRNLARTGAPEETQRNADYSRWGVGQEVYFRPNATHQFAVKLNHFHSYRSLPKLMTAVENDESQTDDQFKSLIEYQRTGKRMLWHVRTGAMYDRILYEDQIAGIESDGRTFAWRNQVQLTFPVNNRWVLRGRWNADHETGSGGGLPERKSQNRVSALWQADYQPAPRWEISGMLRQEVFRDSLIPLLPAAGVRYRFFRQWFLKANYAYNYRPPTFNDLYWQQLGNPNLQPEYGHSVEAGLLREWQPDVATWNITWEATAYYALIQDWIQWVPDATGQFRPRNVREVRNRGVETMFKLSRKWRNATLFISGNYALAESVNQAVASAEDRSIGQQLIYTPLHTVKGYGRVDWRQWTFGYQHSYSGKRYTTTDNSTYLPGYGIGQVQLGRMVRFPSRHAIDARLTIHNVWDEEYQAIAWRPMPGRHYTISIRYTLRS